MRDRLLIALFASLLCGGILHSGPRRLCDRERAPANLGGEKAPKACAGAPRLDANLAFGPLASPASVAVPAEGESVFASAPRLLGALLFLIRTGLSPPA